jgi:capsular exopolysaccharide synthesis family protein
MIVVAMMPTTYSSTANVLIDRRTFAPTDVTSVLSGLPSDSASVDTEVQVLRSPAIIASAVRELKLEQDEEFNPALRRPGFARRVIDSVRGLLGREDATPVRSPTDAVVNNVARNLEVARQGLTYVIGVTVTSEDPKKAAAIANAIARAYVAQQIREKQDAARKAESYLASRLAGLRSEVQKNQGAAEALRARTGLPQGDRLPTFDQQALQDLGRQEILLETQLAQARSRLTTAEQARSNTSSLPQVIESNVIRDLKAQRATLAATNADVSSRYGPLHPETQKARQQIAQLDSEISAEMGRIVSSLRNEVDSAAGQLGVIRGAIGAQRSSAVANAGAAVSVAQYERQASASAEIYQDFLKRAKETGASADLAKSDAVIINQARPPTKPSAPKWSLMTLLSLLAGVAAGVIAVILIEVLDEKISSGADIERYLSLPSIGSVPSVSQREVEGGLPALLVNKPLSSYAEAFRTLGSYLRGSNESDSLGAEIVMVTSALPNEGKTTIATTLALSLARAADRVLLVETDLRKPQVAETLGLPRPEGGVSEALDPKAGSRQGIVRDQERNLDVLLVGRGSQDFETFRDDRFANFLARVRSMYDYIIIDTPPVLAISDPRNIASLCDMVLLVTRWRQTSLHAARAAASALRDADAKVKGVVLNGVNLRKQSLYSQEDSLAFYDSYRQYYVE